MKMAFRWYGEGNDKITLSHIKQIPGVESIAWSLHHKQAGEPWEDSEINKIKKQIEEYGFNIDVVESVNVHEDIKLGLPTRDKYIEVYKDTIRQLSKLGVKVICYNFMPVLDWTRTELYKELDDGSTALFFERSKIEDIDPLELIQKMSKDLDVTMPGWEPERLENLQETFKKYEGFTDEDLWTNLKYFLEQIIPVAKECGVKMGIHPDDPAFSVFGLSRIMINKENIQRLLSLVDDVHNGLTICTGALGSVNNDLPDIIRTFHDRIHFIHIRNVKRFENGDFIESSHRAQDGSIDIVDVVKALHENNFQGYARPDHGRHIWGEEEWARPGCGLYDRALGIMYVLGIWDTLQSK